MDMEIRWIKLNEIRKVSCIVLFSLCSNLVIAGGLNIGTADSQDHPSNGNTYGRILLCSWC